MTDGASVMTKIGKISSTYQQLCFAHGIQLAVIDVLYKNKSKVPVESVIDQLSDNEGDENNVDEESNDVDEECEGEDSDFRIEYDGDEIENDVEECFKPIIDKVRRIVRMFKRSPLKNEVLQAYVKADFPNELSLVLDSKTRWNSLANMLDRFYELRNCIQKAFVDLKPCLTPRQYALSMKEDEFEAISDIANALIPLQVAVEALCRRDANLISADAVFLFTLQKLRDLKSDLSSKLFDTLYKRISERRNDLSAVLQYLHSGYSPVINEKELRHLFTIPSRKKTETIILQLIKRCHSDSVSQVQVYSTKLNNFGKLIARLYRQTLERKMKTKSAMLELEIILLKQNQNQKRGSCQRCTLNSIAPSKRLYYLSQHLQSPFQIIFNLTKIY